MGNRFGHRLKYVYSAGWGEVEEFVAANQVVASFLGKFAAGRDEEFSSYRNHARNLCMFFKWLRVVKGLDVSPSQFLTRVAVSRVSADPQERLWGRNLLLEFSRDNPDFAGKSHVLKYHCFVSVKVFCAYHETPITSAFGIFGKGEGRKHDEPPFTVEWARRILSVLSQRDRSICMVMLQSGQSVKQVLVHVNGLADYIFREIDAGAERIRLDFKQRKGNGTPYFTFISQDAIQEIEKWRSIRAEVLEKNHVRSKWLWITEKATPVRTNCFEGQYQDLLQRKGLWTGPYTSRLHGFRKIFEQEASPPDRGISKHYASFMMGHVTQGGVNNIDRVGGVYDKRPFFDARTVEKEYAKLEPYLNIYSQSRTAGGGTTLTEVQVQAFELLVKVMNKYPEKYDKFERFIREL